MKWKGDNMGPPDQTKPSPFSVKKLKPIVPTSGGLFSAMLPPGATEGNLARKASRESFAFMVTGRSVRGYGYVTCIMEVPEEKSRFLEPEGGRNGSTTAGDCPMFSGRMIF